MELKQVLEKLKSLGTEKMFARNLKNGAGDNQFGVKMGDIRKVAKEIKKNHELALKLWQTRNIDARLLSIRICAGGRLVQLVCSERTPGKRTAP